MTINRDETVEQRVENLLEVRVTTDARVGIEGCSRLLRDINLSDMATRSTYAI